MRSTVVRPEAPRAQHPRAALGAGREFSLIDRHWRTEAASPAVGTVLLGLGDDAALLMPDAQQALAVSVDTMVEGRHYWPQADPYSVGQKLLAVNLSDLAAMGAEPLSCTLSLSLRADSAGPWLDGFAAGLSDASRAFQCPLVGGDTVRLPDGAPNVLTLQVIGQVPAGQALRRDGLQPGDDLWVSGRLGDPADAILTETDHPKLHAPEPRLGLGRFLRGRAHAAIDLSDGLVSELGHLLAASEQRLGQSLGLVLALDALSSCLGDRLSEHLRAGRLSRMECCRRAAEGGDEYELVFSAPPSQRAALEDWSLASQIPLTRFGSVDRSSDSPSQGVSRGLQWSFQSVPCSGDEQPRAGFDHFGGGR